MQIYALRGADSSNGTDTLIYIPLVSQQDSGSIQSFIEARVADTVSLQLFIAEDYKKLLSFEDEDPNLKGLANSYALFIMKMQHDVKGTKWFDITDPDLMRKQFADGKTRRAYTMAFEDGVGGSPSSLRLYVFVGADTSETGCKELWSAEDDGSNPTLSDCDCGLGWGHGCDGPVGGGGGGSGSGSGGGDGGGWGGGYGGGTGGWGGWGSDGLGGNDGNNGGGGSGTDGGNGCKSIGYKIINGKLYTPCGGTGGGSTGGGNNGGGWIPAYNDYDTASDPDYINDSDPGANFPFNFDEAHAKPDANLVNLFKCFDNINDNGATYTIRICCDIPYNANSYVMATPSLNPGHAFITIIKSNGTNSVTQSFGFYPDLSFVSLSNLPCSSTIKDDGGHEYNASYEIVTSKPDFDLVKNAVLQNQTNSYDLNSYNCTNFALDAFNLILSPDLNVPDYAPSLAHNYGQTPVDFIVN